MVYPLTKPWETPYNKQEQGGRAFIMRIRLKINPKTGVVYLPKVLLEDGFKGQADAFGSGPVVVIIRPDADLETVKDCLVSVSKDIELTPRMKSLFDQPDKEHQNE